MNIGAEARAYLRGIAANGRAIVAMMYLEAYKRFGSSPLSFLWTLVEPVILIGGMLTMRVYIKNFNPAFGESSVLFLLTGLLTFRMLRGTINKSSRAIVQNRSVFELGAIKPPDTIIARTVVEYLIWMFILSLFLIGIHRLMRMEVIADFQGFVIALLSNLFFCLGLSMFNGTVGVLVPIWWRIWKIATIPLLAMSGVIYVPMTMPPEIQAIIYWNPFLHCIEGLRDSTYLDYIALYDPTYLNSVSLGLFLTGLAIERLFRKDILRSNNKDDDEEEVFL